MPRQGYSVITAVAVLAITLSGCAPAPEKEPEQNAGEVPEITLNLPEEDGVCMVEDDSADYTFLEKGYAALAESDYEGAVQYIHRYRRLEKSPEVEWEVAMAIAYISSLSDSPFYDPDAARKSFRELNNADWESMRLHQQSLLMRQSLASSIALEKQVTKLEDSNAILREELEKREEAIKRLRELTLGQTGATQ